jgi:hypothetical protein
VRQRRLAQHVFLPVAKGFQGQGRKAMRGSGLRQPQSQPHLLSGEIFVGGTIAWLRQRRRRDLEIRVARVHLSDAAALDVFKFKQLRLHTYGRERDDDVQTSSIVDVRPDFDSGHRKDPLPDSSARPVAMSIPDSIV